MCNPLAPDVLEIAERGERIGQHLVIGRLLRERNRLVRDLEGSFVSLARIPFARRKLREDLCPKPCVGDGLRRSFPQDRVPGSELFRDDCQPELEQRLRPLLTRSRARERLFEQPYRREEVSRRERQPGGFEPSTVEADTTASRRQQYRPRGELCGRRNRPARLGVGNCRVERDRDPLVRPVRSNCEVPRPFLAIRSDFGQPAVRLTPPRTRSALVVDRREERMRETDAAAVELDDACFGGDVDVFDCASRIARSSSSSVGWETAAARSSVSCVGSRQARQTGEQELAEVVRHRQGLVRLDVVPGIPQSARKLEREERSTA